MSPLTPPAGLPEVVIVTSLRAIDLISKLALAVAAVVPPVPPYVTAMVEPFQTPAARVPTPVIPV